MGIMQKNPEVLMIPTLSGAIPFVFPMGMIALLNQVSADKQGLFPREITPALLKKAKVVVLPVHWFYSIQPVLSLAKRIRSMAPHVRILAGGYSATLFYRELLETGLVDAVVRGDSEKPFVEAVHKLLDGKDLAAVPNLAWKGGENPVSWSLSAQEFGRLNYRDIDWFPTFQRLALGLQKSREVTYVFPWIPVVRGCVFPCPDCMATPSVQSRLFNRPPLFRPPGAVRSDLHYWSQRRDVRHCHINADFISMQGIKSAGRILDGSRHALDCYYVWYPHPEQDGADLLADSFARVNHAVFLSPHGQCVNEDESYASGSENKLEDVMKKSRAHKHISWILYLDPKNLENDQAFAKWTARLSRYPRVRVNRIDEKVMPRLDHLDPDSLAGMFQSLGLRASREVPTFRRQQSVIKPVLQHVPRLTPMLFGAGSLAMKRRINKKIQAR